MIRFKRHVFAAAMLSALFLSACGTAPKNNSTMAAEVPPAVSTEAPAQTVRIPPEAAGKVVLGMGGVKDSIEAKDWKSFKEEWRATFEEHARDAGVAFEWQDGEAHATGAPGTLLSVYVNDYRQVGIGARIFFGVMTGNAYIDAKVGFSDLATGERFGEQAFNTSSSAWAGVFGKMTPQQVDAIASDVFAQIKARR